MRVRLEVRTLSVLRSHRLQHLIPSLPFELHLVFRRQSARLSDPPELPGEDIENFLLIKVHELRDSSPASAIRLGEISQVRGRDEVAQGIVVERLEAEDPRHESVDERVVCNVSVDGFFRAISFEVDCSGEEGLEGVKATVVVGVGADVEETAREVFPAGDLREGELGAVEEGEEDLEGVGALGGTEGGVFLVVCEGRVVASESGPVCGGEGGLVERHGADGRCTFGLERDILSLKDICIINSLQRQSPHFHILPRARMLDRI